MMWIQGGGESSSVQSDGSDGVDFCTSSDGEELYSTHVSGTRLGGVIFSDGDEFSMDVRDITRKRRRTEGR